MEKKKEEDGGEEELTSRTEFGQQMRSGELPVYLSLNCLFNGRDSRPWRYFVQVLRIYQKLVYDGRTDQRTSQIDARTYLKLN